MIRIEVMTPEPPRRADFTWPLVGLAIIAVLSIGLAAYRLPIYFAALHAATV